MSKTRIPKNKKHNSAKPLIITLIVILTLSIITLVGVTAFSAGLTLPGIINYISGLFINKPTVQSVAPWQENIVDSNGDSLSTSGREDESFNFLVVGRDAVALNTDVMMIINLDLKNDSMTIMQMPRDTFITVDGTPRKLNSVFGTFYNSSSETDTDGKIADGMKGLAQTLSSNLAINIDYYAYMNLDGFGAIVDAIGGVDMYVPYRMYYTDEYQNPPLYIDLYEGQQTLDGDMAEQFVRFRSSYVNGDLGRQDAQKLFMTAFMESFKNKISITNVVPVVTTIMGNLEHSLSVNDAAYFVKEAMQMDFSNITMFTAPNTPVTYYGGSYVVIHRAAMYKVANESFNVFNEDIPENVFDADFNFTILNDSTINAVYNSTEEFDGTHSAEDIQQDGLDINRAW
ncbi:MAG: LCP family protein [Clostridia bacterium]|nr:LCP family protein [Clostridia bacterium]